MVEHALFWVDIEGKLLQRQHKTSGEVRVWHLPKRIGSFALRETGGLVCAFASDFALFDPKTEATNWIARPDAHIPTHRFNNGRCDRNGPLWAGTMDDELTRYAGSLCRLDPDLSVHNMEDGVGITNALSRSPDDRTFYFTDTLDREIHAYDYDAPSGRISNKRPFVLTRGDSGGPDGSTIDAEGFKRNAQWDGSRLTRYAPDGRVDRVVPLPVQKPFGCIFGRPGLHTHYATSPIRDHSASDLTAQPLAETLLMLDVGVTGLPKTRFAG